MAQGTIPSLAVWADTMVRPFASGLVASKIVSTRQGVRQSSVKISIEPLSRVITGWSSGVRDSERL